MKRYIAGFVLVSMVAFGLFGILVMVISGGSRSAGAALAGMVFAWLCYGIPGVLLICSGRKAIRLHERTIARALLMLRRGDTIDAQEIATGTGMAVYDAVRVLHQEQQKGIIPTEATIVMPTWPPNSPTATAPPPSLHWAVLILLNLLTASIFGVVWAFVQANWVKKLDPRNNSIRMYALCVLLAIVGVAASKVPVLSALLLCAASVFALIGVFGVRRSLIEHYNSAEPVNLRLNVAMTLFFSIVYFQYHLNRIGDWVTPRSLYSSEFSQLKIA